jgi:hypothetical protein
LETAAVVAQDVCVGRLPVAAILVAHAACQGPSAARLFTPDETAALEKRVLDEVAQTDHSCIRPELVALMKPDRPCEDEAIRQRIDQKKDPAFALSPALQHCAEKLAAEVKAIAAAGGGCSPFQVGVVGADLWRSDSRGFWPFHIANLLSHRAHEAEDVNGALHETLDAIRVSQDATRGRVPVMNAVVTATMEEKLLVTALKLVTKQPLAEAQLAALIAKVDELIAREPSIVENMRGEVIYMALHEGVAAMKGPFWIPPGGRSAMFPSRFYRVDFQEDVGASLVSAFLWTEEELTRFCHDDNLATCFLAASAPVTDEPPDIAAEVQGAGTLLALEPSEEARKYLQNRVIAKSKDSSGVFEVPIKQRARVLSRLAALRLQLDALRSHKCPMLEANALGQYHYLQGRPEPRRLGGPLQMKPVDGGIDVLPPGWVGDRRPVARISCP